ncbi:hypothetical protein J2752_000351 [Halarchaeum rubridurum]|uniref:Uncharacterized protein n=1 Tax=Halarchaeum rubridurum TaxID=489911 RepID=A0A830FYX1_9EURY|nr:hypothetical protein [Halarchaeum rubridurum]MBP1953470.1 hypothetical protein [Halarchaeum rubridurum]GGM65036.1 hypothetical protein GCM10009017_13880 [Halarchaeum rubridurum]
MCPDRTDADGPRRRSVLRASLAAAMAGSTAGCVSLFDAGETESDADVDGGEAVAEGVPIDSGAFASLRDGDVVALAVGTGSGAFDPETTDTPVQDALDAVGSVGGGRVYLPPTTVTEAGPIRPHSNTALYGFGMNVSVVHVRSPGTDGVRFDRDESVQRVALDGFELRGPGVRKDTGVAVHYVDATADPANDPADVHVGRLYCRQWGNSVLRVDEGVGPFQCRYDFLRADDCDAGAAGALLDWRSDYGPANHFGTVVAYPNARASGAATTILRQAGGELAFEDVTVGGTAGALVESTAGRLRLGRAHWEPEGQPTTPDALVRLAGSGVTHVGDVVVDAGTVPHVYELARGFGNKHLVPPGPTRGTVTGDVVRVTGAGASGSRSWYYGTRDDVTVSLGVPNEGRLRVLGSAGDGVA